ncbi:MAG TPA: hypothetical protein P5250_04240 [Bacteroidales bacterium]|nr:hypothetical protein [Bacteroidales bacterium]
MLSAIVVLNACGPKKNSPEYVAETFLKHMYKKEFAEAKKLGTEATVAFLESREKDSAMVAKDVKIEDMKCVVNGENAICNYKLDGKDETLNLVKTNDKWLVDMKKEQSMNEMMNNMGELQGALQDSIETLATEAEGTENKAKK